MTKEKKGDSLNDFASNEEEELNKRFEALETQLGVVIKSLKKQTERIDALQELYSGTSDKIKEILEKTLPGDIANAIRELKDVLTKRVGEVVCVQSEALASTLDLSSLPYRDQLNIETLGNTTVVRAKKFLGDLWGPVNDAIKALGGKWIRDGQNSRWEIGGAAASEPEQPKEKPQIKDPSALATPKQLAFLEQLNVYVKPGLTKGEASRLIDSKLGEKKRK